MATTYRATISINVWKQHTCVHCNGKYRYLLSRKMTGTGRTQEAASNAAEANVLRALKTEVDQHPCPTCGLYQPDMVAATRGRAHLWVSIGFLAACLIPVVLGFITNWAWYVPWLAAGLAAVALAAHLFVDRGNPNQQPETNRETARERVERGNLIASEAGDSLAASNEATGSAWRPAGQALLYLLFGLAILALPAGEVLRLAKGWPVNADWRPNVVGPGDKPYAYFPDKISSVKGYWSATGKATIVNSEDGVSREVKLTSNTSSWGDKISVKSSEKDSSSTLFAWVELPNDPKLAGKMLKVKMNLVVTYPKLTGQSFQDTQMEASHTATMIVANDAKAGTTYQQCYWFGLLGGLLVTLATSFGLMQRASSVRSQALPTEIHIPGNDDEATRQQ